MSSIERMATVTSRAVWEMPGSAANCAALIERPATAIPALAAMSIGLPRSVRRGLQAPRRWLST